MRIALASLLVFAASQSLGCTTILDVSLGPYTYDVSSDHVTVPAQLQDTSTNTVRTIPCMTDMDCPPLGAGQPAVHCNAASACDPDPYVFELSTMSINLAQNATVARYGDHVTSIAITSAQFDATNRGLSLPVGPTEIFWGPESAVDTTSAGVQHFGTLGVVDVPAGSTLQNQDIALDPAGNQGLSDHLLHVSRVIRLFARPSVDLAPGSPLPTGSLRLDITIQVHIEGQLVQ